MDRISIFWNLPALKRKHHKCCHRLNNMQVMIPVPWKITPQKGWFPFTTQSGSYSTHFKKSPISSTQHMTPNRSPAFHQHFGPFIWPGQGALFSRALQTPALRRRRRPTVQWSHPVAEPGAAAPARPAAPRAGRSPAANGGNAEPWVVDHRCFFGWF